MCVQYICLCEAVLASTLSKSHYLECKLKKLFALYEYVLVHVLNLPLPFVFPIEALIYLQCSLLLHNYGRYLMLVCIQMRTVNVYII